MTDDMLRFFRERWSAIEAIERQEQRDATIEHRWRQLNRTIALASVLGLAPISLDPEDEMVRQRWARLRQSR